MKWWGPRDHKSTPEMYGRSQGIWEIYRPNLPLTMDIHLCKPGGKREGPFTLERINKDLAAGKYSGSDYWAWHQGLPEWVPLYSLPGVAEKSGAPGAAEQEAPQAETAPAAIAPPPGSAESEGPGATQPAESEKIPSGMAFPALERIFILTSGDGPVAAQSAATSAMLEKITGEASDTVRANVPRDVVGRCDILAGLKGQGSTPGAVWRKMAALRPELLQQAREGAYRICIRNFPIDNGDLVSVFLFYNKQKL